MALLRFCEDIFTNGAVLPLSPAARVIFVVHGSISVADRTLGDGEAFQSEAALMLRAGEAGASVWRWDLGGTDSTRTPGVTSCEKLSAQLATLPQGELLMRGDSVAFPPGGCAYLHRHRGPGIRCLIEGGIRIDTHGHSTSYGPGCAWYESGPDPVFAQAAADRASRFIRVMILPRALLGKSSIEYVNEEDRSKPRVQQYRMLAEVPIARPSD
jgi:hypothetical protein